MAFYPSNLSTQFPLSVSLYMEPSGKRTSFLGQSEEKPGEGPDTLASLQKTNKLLKKKIVSEREEKQTLHSLLKAAEDLQTTLQGSLAERVITKQDGEIEQAKHHKQQLETQAKQLQGEKAALELQVSNLNSALVKANDLEKALEEAKSVAIAEERRRKETESINLSLRAELDQAKQWVLYRDVESVGQVSTLLQTQLAAFREKEQQFTR